MAVVMLWWKQQVNTGYWRKNIYCKWNTAMRAFVLVFVHNQTSQLLFETVRWKHNHCDTRALRPRRDYKLAPLATLKPLASRELLLSQKKYNFSIFQTWFSRYPSPLQCWDMLKQAGDRRSHSWEFLVPGCRPVIQILTLFQTKTSGNFQRVELFQIFAKSFFIIATTSDKVAF